MSITYSNVRNPVWANIQETEINCEVDFDNIPEEEWSSCTVFGSGDMPYIHEIFERCVAGEFGTITPYESPANIPPPNEDGIRDSIDYFIREERDKLLEESDYMMLPDLYNSMSADTQAEWTTYRQALRDMPSQHSTLEGIFNDTTYEFEPSVTITWPTKPS